MCYMFYELYTPVIILNSKTQLDNLRGFLSPNCEKQFVFDLIYFAICKLIDDAGVSVSAHPKSGGKVRVYEFCILYKNFSSVFIVV